METLDIHNNRMYAKHNKSNKNALAGVLCPQCNTELNECNPGIILASNPPKKEVVCPNCGYKGYKVI